MQTIRNTHEYKARVYAIRAVHPADTPSGRFILEMAKCMSLIVIPLAFSAFSLLLLV